MDIDVITIKANSVHDNGNGTFSIELPVKRLSLDHAKVLEELYPNLLTTAHKLLNQEALLASIASEAEFAASSGFATIRSR